MDKYDGDPTKFRGWLFDLLVTIGQVDPALAKDLKTMLQDEPAEDYGPPENDGLEEGYMTNTNQHCMGFCVLQPLEKQNMS